MGITHCGDKAMKQVGLALPFDIEEEPNFVWRWSSLNREKQFGTGFHSCW